MSERELKLVVTAAGAKEAQKELQGTAQAAGQVADASGKATGPTAAKATADQTAADKAKLHREAASTLKEGLSKLGPEVAVVGDVIGAFTLKNGAAAMGVGLFAASILGIVKLYDMWSESTRVEIERQRKLQETLAEERKGFEDLADSIEKATAAERRRKGVGSEKQTTSQEAVSRAASASLLPGNAGAIGGKDVIEKAAESLMSGGMSDEELVAFLMWLRLGYGEGMDSPALRRQAFLAAYRRSPGFGERLKKEFEALNKQFPEAGRKARDEARGIQRGTTPAAERARELEDAAKAMGYSGDEKTKPGESLQKQLRQAVADARSEDPATRARGRKVYEDITGRFPELKDQLFGDQPTEQRTGTGNLVRRSDPELAGRTLEQALPAASIGKQVGQIIGQMFTGGTHYHGQYPDPAGQRNTPSQAGD